MAVATDTLENQLLLLLFQNANLGGIGDATGLRGSTAPGSFFISLHTADPGEAGAQNTSEAGYTGYARVGVVRTAAGWAVANNEASNAAVIQFPASTVGSATITHVGIGTSVSGAGKLLWRMALQDPASMTISAGMAPKLDPGVVKVTVN